MKSPRAGVLADTLQIATVILLSIHQFVQRDAPSTDLK